MRASTGDDDPLDRTFAVVAGLAGAHVDPMLELERSFFAVGIDVVRNGRAAGFDGFVQDFANSLIKFAQLLTGDGIRAAARTNGGAEESFVSIDIAYTAQQLLIEQRAFDGRLATFEERDELLFADPERFPALSCKNVLRLVNGEAAEAARIDKAKLASGAEFGDQMSMFGKIGIRRCDEHLASHAKAHDPLPGFREVDDNVFADALHLTNARALEDLGNLPSGGLQRLGFGPDPNGFDHVSRDALIEPAGDGLDFGKFRHSEAVPSTWYSVASVNNWKIT